MGALILLADSYASKAAPPKAPPAAAMPAAPSDTSNAQRRARSGGFGRVAAGYGLLAANLELSALLYSRGVDYSVILPVLATTWLATWWFLDRTRSGAVLSVVCALGAPAAELVLMNLFDTWHYSRPDLPFGFVSWVPCCYGSYVPQLAALTRYLSQRGGQDAEA